MEFAYPPITETLDAKMPPAKRKVATKASTKQSSSAQPAATTRNEVPKRPKLNPVAKVVGSAQSNEAFHIKYIKELQQSYLQVFIVLDFGYFVCFLQIPVVLYIIPFIIFVFLRVCLFVLF